VIRPLERDDTPLIQAIFDQMSEEARYRRFLGYKKRLSARDLQKLTDVDHHGREALVGLDAESGGPVGVARMIRQPTRPAAAEASVAVVDAWQGRGLGSVLLERLVLRARDEGVRRFTAVLLARNQAMLHLFEHIGAVHITSRCDDTLELEVEKPRRLTKCCAAAAGHVQGSGRRPPKQPPTGGSARTALLGLVQVVGLEADQSARPVGEGTAEVVAELKPAPKAACSRATASTRPGSSFMN
jgi:GNAT superfamily N-acetyltransferase